LKKEEYKAFASKMRTDLYKALKLVSVAEDLPIHELLEDAVLQYLADPRFERIVSPKKGGQDGMPKFCVKVTVPKKEKKK
jgi:hypothetical protein